ncbi:MAG: hypothetical protein A2017_17330 [Lentisphaerae bacterium GWF2_44_16]|nr:MAG: hypothetical protein A2017_17330 [Lentisphaerae bacterium GWF2_44_16]
MSKIFSLSFCMILLCVLTSSCSLFKDNSKPEHAVTATQPEGDINKEAELSPKMVSSAALFKKSVSSKCSECAVYMNERLYKIYEKRENVLAARCSVLGITDVYLYFNNKDLKDKEFSLKLRTIISALHSKKIRCHAMLHDPAIYADDRKKTAEEIKNVLAFNEKSGGSTDKFDGLFINIQPHEFSRDAQIYKSGIMYKWNSDTSYGLGKDNDLLMKQAFVVLEEARKCAPSVELGQKVAWFYDSDAGSGKLSLGKTDDFLKHCDYLMVSAYSSEWRDILEYILPNIRHTEKKNSILLAVKTSVNINGGDIREVSLSWKGWFRICKDMENVIKNIGKYPSFRGVVFQDYEGLEKAWE